MSSLYYILQRVLYRDLLFYTIYAFVKWKIIRGNGFAAISCFMFVSPKFDGRIYTNVPMFFE